MAGRVFQETAQAMLSSEEICEFAHRRATITQALASLIQSEVAAEKKTWLWLFYPHQQLFPQQMMTLVSSD